MKYPKSHTISVKPLWRKSLTMLVIASVFSVSLAEAKKQILFLAGKPSHRNGEHEFRAGSMLLAKALNESGLDVEAQVHYYGWPKDESIFDGVDACVIYADAGGRFGEKYAVLDEKVKAGMGIMFLHYGVHPSKEVGQKYFMPWIGGYMETGWSVNPHWIADISPKSGHPVGHGVTSPFSAFDEFYWNMRFPSENECDCCHALATAIPTPEKIVRYINLWNEHGIATMGKPQALMWCRDPEKGARGIGFVGGHYHRNWAIDDFRKLILNSIVWLARIDVPKDGVSSKPITQKQLNENLDKPNKDSPILLPTEQLLKQKPMEMPVPRKKKKQKVKSASTKKIFFKSLAESRIMRANDAQRIQVLNTQVKGLKQIELYVSAEGRPAFDWANWINPVFKDSEGQVIPVEEKHILSNTQEHKELRYNLNTSGNPMMVAGEKVTRGIGTHAPSSIILKVPTSAITFSSEIALDDGGTVRNGKPSVAAVKFSVRNPAIKVRPKAWQPTGPARNVDLEYFKVPEGLDVTRWATSPLLFNPTNIDIDHKGRIWVAEGVNYRRSNGRRPAGDRIAVLEDTNGDGVADKSHTFVQEEELVAPLGVAVFDNVVVVAQPPNIIVYTDVDRNLKFNPEIDKREILLTGFNAANHDHSLHSMTAGPDGKWYFNNGNCGAIFTDKSGKTFRMGGSYYKSGGGDWIIDHRKASGQKSDDGFLWTSGFSVRMNPDGTNAEIIGHGYRNSFEHATTSLGDLFQNDNDDPPACRVSYVLEYGSAGYFSRDGKRNWRQEARPGQEHWRAHWRQDDPGTFEAGDIYGGGSPTGIVFYENGALGDKWQGLLLSAEAGKNVIFGYQPKMKGATWQLDRNDFCTTNEVKQYSGSDFVGRKQNTQYHSSWKGKETPIQFRPSDVAVGPDGAIYISDWFDARVGGHTDVDESCSGAIYRIAPKGFKSSIPEVNFSTIDGQIAALSSPAINVRYSGFKGLVTGGAASLDPVTKLLSHPNKWVAARAIWLLPHLGDEGLRKCISLLDDKNPETRLTAYRAIKRAGKNFYPYALKMANDDSPAIRRDAALSMRGLSAEKAIPVLVTVAKKYDGKDKNYLESIGLGAENHEAAVWLEMKKALGTENPAEWSHNFARITWRLWPTTAITDLQTRALNTGLTLGKRMFALESLSFIESRRAADALLNIADSDTTEVLKQEAAYWLLRRSIGAWRDMNLMPELKKRGIYDPDNIVAQAMPVPKPEKKASFTAADVLALKGNAKRGKTTIMRCVACHEIDGNGVNYGPGLQGWGQTQSPEIIANSIINPSADIAHGFKGSIVKLKSGGEIHGLLLNRIDPVIIRSTGGITQIIPKSQISATKNLNRSLMLSADQLGLTAQDVADIVEYMKKW